MQSEFSRQNCRTDDHQISTAETMKQKDEKSNGRNGSLSNGKQHQTSNGVKTKSKNRNKCDLGPNFVAPDGGWGWLVLVAAGCSNVCQYSSTLST